MCELCQWVRKKIMYIYKNNSVIKSRLREWRKERKEGRKEKKEGKEGRKERKEGKKINK